MAAEGGGEQPPEVWTDAEVGPLSPPVTQPFDPEPGREKIRGRLAATLVGAVLFGSFMLSGGVVVGWLDLATAKELATAFLSPLFGLAGAAVGFYYATGGKR